MLLDLVELSAPACWCWVADDLRRVLPSLQPEQVQWALTADAFYKQAAYLTEGVAAALHSRVRLSVYIVHFCHGEISSPASS
jgi:hypothetical protein